MLWLTTSGPGCFVDVAVRPGQTGELRWDCQATFGGAEIIFDGGVFRGAFRSNAVSVCIGTRFEYSDGCLWQSAQRIDGSPIVGTQLTFEYLEKPDTIGKPCASACSATGRLMVE